MSAGGSWSDAPSGRIAKLEEAEALAARGRHGKALHAMNVAVWNLESIDEAQVAVATLRRIVERSDGRQRRRYEAHLAVAASLLRRLELDAQRDRLRVAALRQRLDSLLKLLLYDAEALDASRAEPILASPPERSRGAPEDPWRRLSDSYTRWTPNLIAGYVRGHGILDEMNISPLMQHRGVMTRTLKSCAADLLTHGAEIKGLSEDAVPLVAYALVAGLLPAGVIVDDAALDERASDAVLSQADFAATLAEQDRPVFLAIYRLAFLLGITQAYAERLSMTKLAIT